jgi:hypothetical protein
MLRHRNDLPVEALLPGFDGATAWLHSGPFRPSDLDGHVVLVSFGTYTCINWFRSLPLVRAWSARYAGAGLFVIGIQTPEFAFEAEIANVERALGELHVGYPVAVDNEYAVWRAFDNHYRPALYFVDAEGRIRHHHFGEGEYEGSEMVLQVLLREAGVDVEQGLVNLVPGGVEKPADWRPYRSHPLAERRARRGQFTGRATCGCKTHAARPASVSLGRRAIQANDPDAGERPIRTNQPRRQRGPLQCPSTTYWWSSSRITAPPLKPSPRSRPCGVSRRRRWSPERLTGGFRCPSNQVAALTGC